MVLKRNEGGLIGVYVSGQIRFHPRKFSRALGEALGGHYHMDLKRIAPDAMSTHYPRLSPDEAATAAPALFQLIEQAIEKAELPTGTAGV